MVMKTNFLPERGKRIMMRTTRNALGLGMLIAMLFSACATTQLTAVWKDPSYQGHPNKIMVIGVAKRPANRRIFEDEFVRQIKALGTDAIASYTVLPDEKQGDHAVIAAKMKEQGADAVLITRMVSKKTVRTYIPESVYYPSFSYRPWHDYYPSYYGTWRDYYGYGYQAVHTPGYIAEDEYALMETNLYNAENDNLVWSALSETEIMGSNQNLIKSYIGVMVNTMADQKLFR